MKRLTIVVPYRARADHLRKFIPALRTYFSRDKADCLIPYRVLIIEQEDGLPFNGGSLKNIGFRLGRDDSDYTCFHDVDYLPMWADYSWSESPAAIVWYGAESRAISASDPRLRIFHDLDGFFGAVILTPNALFEQVNGYANSYWGWGYEDADLKLRYRSAGIATARRKGTFQPLPHDNAGYNPDGSPVPTTQANRRLFESRWTNRSAVSPDGLSTLAFDILSRCDAPKGPPSERPARWEIVTVRPRVAETGNG